VSLPPDKRLGTFEHLEDSSAGFFSGFSLGSVFAEKIAFS
jgi:hypothetical protein